MAHAEDRGSNSAINLRNRWGQLRFAAADANSSNPTCELKLVYPVRLWSDETNLDKTLTDSAWACFQQRMNAVIAGTTRNGTVEPLWTAEAASDNRIAELSAAARQLFLNEPTVRVWTTGAQALARFFRTQTVEWSASGVRGSDPIPIRFSGLEVWASHCGIGYLVISITLKKPTDDAALASFLDLVHFSRYLDRREHASLDGRFKRSPEHRGATQEPPTLEFCETKWSADGTNASIVKTSIDALCTWLLDKAIGDSSALSKEPGALYAHLSLENPCAARAYVFAMLTSDTERPPKVALNEVLTQLIEMAPAGREVLRPPSEWSEGAGVRVFEYSEGAFFGASRECTAFVAVNQKSTDFWRNGMPEHLQKEYFAIQILTLLQRHQIDELRRLIAVTNGVRDDTWRRLQARAIELKSRGFFVEVSVRTNHARFEHLLRTVTNLERAYEIAVTLVDSLIETHISMQQADANELPRRQEKLSEKGTKKSS